MHIAKVLVYAGLLVSATIGAALIFVVVVLALTFIGGPSLEAECGDRTVEAPFPLALQFDDKWGGFDDRLDTGQSDNVSFSESETTARATAFFLEHGIDEIRDITICFFGDAQEGEMRGKADLPVLPNVTAKLRGRMDLSGPVPLLTITDIDIGSLPGFLTNLIDGPIEDAINDGLADLDLAHRYTIRFGDGTMTVNVNGQP